MSERGVPVAQEPTPGEFDPTDSRGAPACKPCRKTAEVALREPQ
jgi:hypothetical protein